MRINRGLVFWGVALITAGVVVLAIQSNLIDAAQARQIWRYWPVVLILIGLAIVTSRTPAALVVTVVIGLAVGGLAGTLITGWPDAMTIGCGGQVDRVATADGRFDGPASVELDFNCGDLDVSMTDGDRWDVKAGYAGNSEPRISSTGDQLVVDARNDGFPGFGQGRQDWSIVLPRDVRLALNVDANAASSRLDLDGGEFGDLDVDANAGSLGLVLDGASVDDLAIDANAGSIWVEVDGDTTLSGSMEINAGSMELCVPDGVGVAITVSDSNITFSHNLDERGLARSGDTWTTPGDGSDITLRVTGNAASFTLNPEDGCS